MEDQLVKGSIRSLPHGQMQNIKRMFEKQCDQDNTISEQLGEAEPDDTNTDTVDMEQNESSSSRWRQHISPTQHGDRASRSPIRAQRHVSPSNPESGSYHPKPTPRKHIDHHGISGIQVKQFGQIATSVALSPPEDDTYSVSKVRDQFEQNPPRKFSEGNIKVPLKPKIKSPSPARKFGNSPSRVPEKKSPVAIRKHSPEKNLRDDHVYSKIWEKKSGTPDLDVPNTEETHRPVSVFERSKMFEGVGSTNNNASLAQGTLSPSKPVKPPPPLRERSFSGGNSDNAKLNSQGKPLPPRPPVRQKSVNEKSKEKHLIKESNENPSIVHSPVSQPPPPVKPKRTGAHDDYMKVKLENQASEGRIKIEETQNENCDNASVTQTKNVKVDFSKRELPEVPVLNKKKKPTRPPPPRSKPRPFSIATDSVDFRSSEGSDSDEMSDHNNDKDDNPFYEMIPAQAFLNKHKNEQLKHWDLPRISHPEPIRRSLSAECIQKAVDEKGNVIYVDPDQLGIGSNKKEYDIYVDTEGYAVPHRLIRRNNSTDDTNEPVKAIGDRVKSKFRRFKNLFSEQDKPAPEKSSTSDRGSQKRKVDAIRNKVNQAFEVLQSSLRQKNNINNNLEDSEDEDDELAEKLSNDSDSKVDEREIRKRVEYSRSIRIKTSKSIKETRQYEKKIYPQLFEHAMIVSLHQNSDTGVYEPYVVYKFPEIRNYKLTMEGKLFPCSEAKDTNVSVPLFCFPDAANFKPTSSSSKSQSYNFVLTNFDGGRVYGYCRRLVPPKSPNKIPEVICIISPIDAFNMYNTLLEEIEKTRLVSLDAAQELIAASFGRPLPSPGQTETIRTLDEHGEMETIFVTRDTDNRIENVNCECLLTSLGPDKLLKVFSTILLERSVLFCAKHLSKLSSTIHAIVSLLYPFSWQHTFIPVLPSDMIDVVCSPTPYIIGITASLLPKLTDLPIDENVLIVDIDKRSFIRSQGDEGTLLPKKIEKALKTSLNMCRIDSDAKNSPDLMISEAFVRFFVEAIGHYGQFIITQQDGKRIFRKESFVKGTSSSSLQQLLEWFVETQMFEVFITKQIEKTDWGNTIEFFQSRVQENMFAKGHKRRLGKTPGAPLFSPEKE
ncbi:uncharacterized protein LOC132724716 isoform X2 [Ruditapes philippinarum]|uniref:uncharacterized protein LOC132724716 isoform X2 n=1 Tax=Ruditapes philippinarum TaxID=129788 RepID=UPI00295A9367|nr:uncharacterized protein LOC132724716 isoform X2 [Ruditapes philippinarum]